MPHGKEFDMEAGLCLIVSLFHLRFHLEWKRFLQGKGHILIQKSTCMQMFTDTDNEGLLLLMILVILINL